MKALLLLMVTVGCGSTEKASEQTTDLVALQAKDSASKDTPVAEKGDRGEIGPTGPMGPSGRDGIDGKDGKSIKGDTGSAGKDAVSTVGATGATGAAGQDAQTIKLIDASNVTIGSIYGINTSTSEYWVINGTSRYEISRSDGTFRVGHIFYSGANCTGTKKIGIVNGQFANVVIEYTTGAILKAKGTQTNSWSYASRSMQGACSNTSGTVNRAFDYDTVATSSLGYTYPIQNPEMAN